MSERSRSALLIVDVQRDFCAGGDTRSPHADRVVAPLNRLSHALTQSTRPIYLSRDWHPATSNHFAAFGGGGRFTVWPAQAEHSSTPTSSSRTMPSS